MLTHLHMVVYTWWCWHIYKGGGVPRDLALLRKLSAYFLLRRWEIWRSRGSVLAEKHSLDAGVGSTGRWSRASGVVSVCGSGVQSAPDAERLLFARPVWSDVSKCARGVSDWRAPDAQGASGGLRPVTLSVCGALCARVRCAPDASVVTQ